MRKLACLQLQGKTHVMAYPQPPQQFDDDVVRTHRLKTISRSVGSAGTEARARSPMAEAYFRHVRSS